MKKIEVKILEHNLNGMAKFLAQLTQRGQQISCMDDLDDLCNKTIGQVPSPALLTLPHSTLRRMNYITIAITGLSTKALSQIRTHATRLTFVSTSTQYSSYEDRKDNYVMPDGLNEEQEEKMKLAYHKIQLAYNELIVNGVDKDKAGYLLPQGLRKALIASGTLDNWEYVLRTRLCRRNTLETQHIMRLIYKALKEECGEEFLVNCLPTCVCVPERGLTRCLEQKFSCGNPLKKEEIENE